MNSLYAQAAIVPLKMRSLLGCKSHSAINRHAGFHVGFIPVYLLSAGAKNPGCKPLSGMTLHPRVFRIVLPISQILRDTLHWSIFKSSHESQSAMNATVTSFFSREENQTIFRRFILALESAQEIEPPTPNVLKPLKSLFKIITNNANLFDQHCTANIEWIGKDFISALSEFPREKSSNSSGILTNIFIMAYRFLCEIELSQVGELSFELRFVKNFVEENLKNFSNIEQRDLIYANYIMPANIIKKLIHNPALNEFKAFNEIAKEASKLKQEWDNEIITKSEEIEMLREGLRSITTAYNFVGLVKGFEGLASTKKRERRNSFISLLCLGTLMMLPVAAQLWFIANHIDAIDLHRNTLIYSLPPIITLEIILIYMFRVVLSHFRGIATQMLQINLRISLCQFIQSYSEYSTKIKRQDASALEKFENLIFSGIISDSEALPSTFDGLEQIAKLVNSIRSGKQ